MRKILFSIIIVIIIVLSVFAYFQKDESVPLEENIPVVQDSVVGCYVSVRGEDVYSLNIASQDGESFEGTLVFDNYEKDSSSGTFVGTYKDGILLGEYSFHSEGMFSVVETIFKKSGDNFVRGFGPLNENGDSFTNLDEITYDLSAPFKYTNEDCPTSL